jgi:cell fate regulator YaaT (PSP1 superfamily)
MGCSNCSTEGGVPKGCKSNGACGAGGCGKLSVYDWLADIDLPNGQSTYDVVEVRFKNSRKAFFRNMKDIQLQVGDAVVVEASPGHDVGVVSVVGELARIQVRKKAPNFKPHEARKIYRKASKEDVEKWKESREREKLTMFRSREVASELALDMKISDVEYQGDGTKATFYYTAEDRIDFRQLIKDLADTFKVRIEMKQIGVRQEAARLGGIGSCGRELCCSTWLTDFRSVSTAAARYQQLSLNPQKLAGQCGKLKCCLNYELDSYLDALKSFPSSDVRLQTEKGHAFHIKTDVFKGQMWYMYEERGEEVSKSVMVPLSPSDVKEVIEMNKAGKKPLDLKSYMVEEVVAEPDYTNVVGQDSLNRFDNAFKKKGKNKKKKGKGAGQGGENRPQQNQGIKAVEGEKRPQQNPRPQGQKPNPNQNRKPQNSGQAQANKPQQNKSQQNKSGQQRDASRGNENAGEDKQNKPQNSGQQNQKPKPNPNQTPRPQQQAKPQNQVKPDGSVAQGAGGAEGEKKASNNKRRNKNRNRNRNQNKPNGESKPEQS